MPDTRQVHAGGSRSPLDNIYNQLRTSAATSYPKGKLYAPNGERECARRRKAIEQTGRDASGKHIQV